ncbi:autophagy-related protein 101-like protein, partial [Leptotrombidium deliense]
FNYKHEGSYSIGTLGYEEVKCDFIDFTYVRCASESLVERINKDVKDFVEKLRESDELKGSLNLEFYCKRKGRMWPLNETPIVWEIWVLKIDCIPVLNVLVGNAGKSSERVEEALLEKLLTIVQIVNSSKCYLPQMPNRENVDTVFDTSHRDVQPYIYKIVHKIGNAGAVSQTTADFGPSSAAIKKLIKHTKYYGTSIMSAEQPTIL